MAGPEPGGFIMPPISGSSADRCSRSPLPPHQPPPDPSHTSMTTPPVQAAPKPTEGGGEKSPYRATLNLPKTSFPMKANLIQNEPASLKRWSGLYDRLRHARAGRPRFIFHDGPPYANGSIH